MISYRKRFGIGKRRACKSNGIRLDNFPFIPIPATICMVVPVSLFMVATQRETPQRDVSSRPKR